MNKCSHKFVNGFGLMGDAVVCVKCNYSKYPEMLSFLDKRRKVIENTGVYGHMADNKVTEHLPNGTMPPFVVKFDANLTLETDWNTWTHGFTRSGHLRERSYFEESSENERSI